jgi:fibronectin type 3 domain-containing protein
MRPFLSFFVVSFLAGAISFSGCSSDKKSAGFGAPKNLSATDGSYIDQVKISWSSVNGAEKYVVYRCDTVDGTYSVIGTSEAVSFSDKEALSGIVYYYSAKAWSSSNGYSDFSNVDSGSTGTMNTLSAPVILVVPGSASITVSWNAVSGAEKYFVYRKGPSDSDYTSFGSVTDVTYVDSSAVQGLTYTYSIRAYSSAGFSDYSAEVSGVISSALGTPSGVGATLSDSAKITLSWSTVSGADSYNVWRASSLNGSYTQIATGITTLTYDDIASVSSLNHGSYYYYRIGGIHLLSEQAS